MDAGKKIGQLEVLTRVGFEPTPVKTAEDV